MKEEWKSKRNKWIKIGEYSMYPLRFHKRKGYKIKLETCFVVYRVGKKWDKEEETIDSLNSMDFRSCASKTAPDWDWEIENRKKEYKIFKGE